MINELKDKQKYTLTHKKKLSLTWGPLRCAYMMTDGEVAYANHSTVYRVLKEARMHQKKADRPPR